MLKITDQFSSAPDRVSLVLEGRLAGPWVAEVDSYWRRMAVERRNGAAVDLSGVSFVDADGKALLSRMWQEGAKLSATGCLMRCLVEEITGEDHGASPCGEQGQTRAGR